MPHSPDLFIFHSSERRGPSTGLTYRSRRAAPEPHARCTGTHVRRNTSEHPAARLPCPTRRCRHRDHGGALLLAGCGAANEAAAPPAPGGGAPAAGDRLRHDRRRRRHLAAGGDGGLDRRLPERQPRRHRQLRPSGSGAGRTQFIGGRRCSSPAATQRSTRRSFPPRSRRAAARTRHPDAALHLADRRGVQPAGRGRPPARPPTTIAKIFNRQITNWNDPAIAADEPGRAAARPEDHPGEPLRRVGHHRELHRVPVRGGRPPTGPTSPTACGRSRAARLRRAPRVSSARSAGGQGTIGYADVSQAGDLGKVEGQGRRRLRRSAAGGRGRRRRGISACRGPGQVQLRDRADQRDTTPAPTRSCWCPTRSPAPNYTDAASGERGKAFLDYMASAEGQKAAAETAGSAPISDAQRSTFQPAIDAIAAAG